MTAVLKIKDTVWIHLGEPRLVQGRIVDIVDLEHLDEGHSPNRLLYIIELKTGIDDVYEVRSYEQISLTEGGPINLFKKFKDELLENKRFLNKVGVKIPVYHPDPLAELAKDLEEETFTDPEDPTPEQINAAIQRHQQNTDRTIFNPTLKSAKKRPARKNFTKRKKPDTGAQ